MAVVLTLANAIPGFVRLGQWQLPTFGLLATMGLVVALFTSQRTAPLAGLDPKLIWDAGVVAVVGAFIASRALLILVNTRTFFHQPLLVLAQPSLSPGSLAITALLVWFWLRHKGLPLLDVMDVWTPCGALLWAVRSFGHFAQGTDAGMPTGLPWGVIARNSMVPGKVHPVQLYAMAIAAWMSYSLFKSLRTRRYSGQVATRGLILQGVLMFFLGMLRQPAEPQRSAWLDPGQYVALAVLSLGLLVRFYLSPPPLSGDEAATILENDALGRAKGIEAIEYGRFQDPLLVEVRGDRVGDVWVDG